MSKISLILIVLYMWISIMCSFPAMMWDQEQGIRANRLYLQSSLYFRLHTQAICISHDSLFQSPFPCTGERVCSIHCGSIHSLSTSVFHTPTLILHPFFLHTPFLWSNNAYFSKRDWAHEGEQNFSSWCTPRFCSKVTSKEPCRELFHTPSIPTAWPATWPPLPGTGIKAAIASLGTQLSPPQSAQ